MKAAWPGVCRNRRQCWPASHGNTSYTTQGTTCLNTAMVMSDCQRISSLVSLYRDHAQWARLTHRLCRGGPDPRRGPADRSPGSRRLTRRSVRRSVRSSASKLSIRRFVITEKAPTRAFSWLKAATTAFTFKTLLRHYAKRVLTPRSLNVKLGPRHKSQKGRAGWLA